MVECFYRRIEEVLDDEKKLIEIKDLDCLTVPYNIYDASGRLDLNDDDLKMLCKKELDKKGKSKKSSS